MLTEAIKVLGLQSVAQACGVTYQAVRKWEDRGFPRTEWTGETEHAKRIEALSRARHAEDPGIPVFEAPDLMQHARSLDAVAN